MKVTASQLAKMIIKLSHEMNYDINNLKLQKLMYFSEGHFYQEKREKLQDREFEAWVHGPVISSVYGEYRYDGLYFIAKEEEVTISEELKLFLKKVLKKYGDMIGPELEDLSHEEMPWQNARSGLSKFELSKNKIKDQDIRDYYLNTKKSLDD